MKSFYPILILLTLGTTCVSAQKIDLSIAFNDTLLKSNKIINYQKEININELNDELSNVLSQLQQQAFLMATLDSIIIDSSYYKTYINLGKTFKWNTLTNKNIDEEVLSKIGFRDKLYNNKPFSKKQLQNFFRKIILYYENNGHPFASIKLDSTIISNNKLSAQLYLEKNKRYKIDSVLIKGNAKISPQYIKNYIRIKDGDTYNEEAIRKISSRIKELPFVAEEKKWKIIFTEEKSKILLYLKKKQASRFDGILGLLPEEETGKLRLTGDLKLNLINSFHNGEKIEFNWRAIQENTQDLKFNVLYPFLVNTPIGLDYNFKLYKKDTTFIDVGHKIGLRYLLKGNNYFKVFFHNKSSSLLSQAGFANLSALPSYADVSSQLYGIEIHNEKLDYLLNPRKGHQVTISGSSGNKSIKQNPQIDEKLYEGVNLKSTLYNAELNANYYIPLSKRSVIKLASKSSYTFNENLFENELLRIGGLHTLRGFDEESIFANLYTIETLEYRYLLEQNSYLYLFFDGAYYESDALDQFIADRPFGFGTGMSFETKAGIFSISYAVGKQFDNPIEFRSAKIHFGFVNFF
ncbi:MAG: POTRA domain-containing protein [Vicingaceae bacterium]